MVERAHLVRKKGGKSMSNTHVYIYKMKLSLIDQYKITISLCILARVITLQVVYYKFFFTLG